MPICIYVGCGYLIKAASCVNYTITGGYDTERITLCNKPIQDQYKL